MEKHDFKVGDRLILKQEFILNNINNLDLIKEERPELFTLPYITVTEITHDGFKYKEQAEKLPSVIARAFERVLIWQELPEKDKKEFIKKIVGSLYTDRHMYCKIELLLKDNEHRTT